MLSKETEARMTRILLSIAESQRSIEINKQVLNDNFDYNPFQIFNSLDNCNKNKIDLYDIINFLNSKCIFANETEVNFLILQYDIDNDCCLSFNEFLNLIQNTNSLNQKNPYNNNNKLSFNVEYSLSKLLEKEIELCKNLLFLFSDIKTRFDFNIHEIFHSLKGFNNYITHENIKNYLDKNKANYYPEDINYIMKRLDINKDGKIDLNEFHTLLGYPECQICCPNNECRNCGCIYCDSCYSDFYCFIHQCFHNVSNVISPNFSKREIQFPQCCTPKSRNCFSMNNSPIRNCRRDIGERTEEVINNSNYINNINSIQRQSRNFNNFENEKRISENLSLRLSPERKFPSFCYKCNCNICICNKTNNQKNSFRNIIFNNIKLKKNPNQYEECQFNDYLKEIMYAESKIENLKIDLSLQKDFNPEDAFRIFENENKGFLTKEDLKDGLNLLNVYSTDLDIRLLMKRFDLKKQNIINFADFFDMIVPYDKKIRDLVENKIPNSCCNCRCPDIFTIKTRNLLKNLFEMLIDYENKFNCMKRGYTTLRLKLKDIFNLIDTLFLGSFNNEDLVYYLKQNCIFRNSKDADLLYIRLDKNRDGKIDFFEIEDELQTQY